MVAAFPIVKLGALAARQISKPLAKQIQIKAKTSPVLRSYLCLPLANLYHRLEVTFKMRSLNLKKPKQIAKLSETAAIELGAELLGEIVIFTVAAVTVTFEYRRQSKAKQLEASQVESRWSNLVYRLRDLELQMDKMNAQLRHLERVIHGSNPAKTLEAKSVKVGDNNNNDDGKDKGTKSTLGKAFDGIKWLLGFGGGS